MPIAPSLYDHLEQALAAFLNNANAADWVSALTSVLAIVISLSSAWFTWREKVRNGAKLEVNLYERLHNNPEDVTTSLRLEMINYGGLPVVVRKIVYISDRRIFLKERFTLLVPSLPFKLEPAESREIDVTSMLTRTLKPSGEGFWKSFFARPLKVKVVDGTGKVWTAKVRHRFS